MKITLTGSLGNIGKPLTQELVQNGHEVTVISSNPEKQPSIETLGAKAAIGSLEDVDFVTAAFKGADAVYTMVPPANYFNPDLDLVSYFRNIGSNYAEAIRKTGVKNVVNLSTIGGHMNKDNGILLGAHYVEEILNELPADIAITHLRPTEIFNNLLAQIPSVKYNGFIAGNISGNVVNSWVSPKDIASAAAEEITKPITGRKVRYVASEELNYNELVQIIGEAVGKPDLEWKVISDEQMRDGMIGFGMQPAIAAGMAEMYKSINSGLLYEDYKLHKPELGSVKAKDFAEEFAATYNQN